ncbi:RCC1 domain-containing protein [Micromonospora humida]|uniref:RCC1 domain-containing protein n=1 Tax=Micromonospora humida TaxID=2809018 RepID=UPI00366C200A
MGTGNDLHPTPAATSAHRRRSEFLATVAALVVVLMIGDAYGATAGRAVAFAMPPNPGTQQVPAKLGTVTAIAAGDAHSIALLSNGTVVTWGENFFGQLGDGTNARRTTAVRVCAVGQSAPCSRFLTGVIAIAANRNDNLALLRDHTVVAWGYNSFGQLGDGTWTNRTTPVRVCAVGQVAPCGRFLSGVRSIAAGWTHTLAAMENGSAVAWGWNGQGQLGDGTTATRLTPVKVCAVGQVAPCGKFLSGVRSVAAGWGHSLAVVGNALAVAWGRNYEGQLGDGTTVGRTTPVRVCAVGQVAPCDQFLYAVNAIAGGEFHSMSLRGDGGPVGWGANYVGELGDGTVVNRAIPVRVCAVGEIAPCHRFLYGIRHIAVGASHSMAQLSSGGVLGWGFNGYGQLGNGTWDTRLQVTQVCAVGEAAPCDRPLSGVRSIAAGTAHSLALQPDYTVAAWGYNAQRQLGDGTTTWRPTPVQVLAPPNLVPHQGMFAS